MKLSLMTSVRGEKREKMTDDERYLKGKFDSGTTSAINTGNACSTTRNLYYEQLQKQSDRDYFEYAEIVRCKDCEACCINYSWNGTAYYNCAIDGRVVKQDDFCSWGKKQEHAEPIRPIKHGKWLKNGYRYCECSVCHHEGNTSGHDNYCWYCGAKMDGRGE